MECSCMNFSGSIYFQCRKKAARYNPELESRERAAEYLGVSVSSLANYELGITVVPVDVVIRMADLYSAPQLRNLYCKNECPLGEERPLAVEVKSIETVTLGVLSILDEDKIRNMKKQLLQIAEDGVISDDEIEVFNGVVEKLDKFALTISEVKLLANKIRRK